MQGYQLLNEPEMQSSQQNFFAKISYQNSKISKFFINHLVPDWFIYNYWVRKGKINGKINLHIQN